MKILSTNGLVLYEDDAMSIKECLVAAVQSGADLYGADLRGADLRDADLRGANLRRADLSDADIRDADLRGANLYGADFYDAKINWQSPTLIAEILKRSAGVNVKKRKIAGLVEVSTDWCWDKMLTLKDPLTKWALTELAKWIVEDDAHPEILDEYVEVAK